MKTMIGLGVLSIPSAFNTLGIVPGVICMCTIAGITTWSNYIVGVFKLRHREVYGIDDAGGLIFGRPGREILGAAFCICEFLHPDADIIPSTSCSDFPLDWVFVSGSGMLGISIGLNAISHHGTCTAVFVAVAAIIGLCLASIRTLGRISWIAWVGLASILSSSKY